MDTAYYSRRERDLAKRNIRRDNVPGREFQAKLTWKDVARIKSKFVFLFALNVFLLIVGCVMDIFSAIVVVVPIIVPVAAAFGVEPVHLGVIFLANLELGYLTPPVGLNLFLASYRFKRPLAEVYRDTFPFLLLLLGVVLVVTYVPWFTEVGQQFLRARATSP